MCRIDPLLMLYRFDMNDILYICYIWKAVYSCCCAFNLFIHFLSNLAYSFSINVETNPQVLSLSLSLCLSLTCSVLCLSPCLRLRWLFRLSSPLSRRDCTSVSCSWTTLLLSFSIRTLSYAHIDFL